VCACVWQGFRVSLRVTARVKVMVRVRVSGTGLRSPGYGYG